MNAKICKVVLSIIYCVVGENALHAEAKKRRGMDGKEDDGAAFHCKSDEHESPLKITFMTDIPEKKRASKPGLPASHSYSFRHGFPIHGGGREGPFFFPLK